MSSCQGIEFGDGLFLRVAEEMKATDTLDGYNLVFLERVADISEFIRIVWEIERFSIFVEGESWSAVRAGDRLGMEASIGWIRIFFLAVGTHCEIAHCRGRAIVGTRFRYGEARSTESAGEKKVTESSVFRISEFREAVVAEEKIGRNFNVSLSRARADDKSRMVFFGSFGTYGIDTYVRWQCR